MFKKIIAAISRLLRRQRKQEAPQLPMPGLPPRGTPDFSAVRVSVRLIAFDDNPEWARQLFADEDFLGPLPTHAELQESLFAEIERLGIKIPE